VDGVPPHSDWPVDTVQFEIETARVAHHVAVGISSPDGGRFGSAIGAAQVDPFGSKIWLFLENAPRRTLGAGQLRQKVRLRFHLLRGLHVVRLRLGQVLLLTS